MNDGYTAYTMEHMAMHAQIDFTDEQLAEMEEALLAREKALAANPEAAVNGTRSAALADVISQVRAADPPKPKPKPKELEW